MTPQDFAYLRDFLKTRSGIVISTDKLYLVESRLTPVARDLGLGGIDDLIAALKKSTEESLRVKITDAMTTNESFFFRDQTPFENLFDHVLPRLVEARKAQGKNKIRIWSAACSSGQEPYTIAMMLRENADRFAGTSFEIIGTDLSTEIVRKAREGKYSQFEVQRGLPITLLIKYFTQEGDQWRISQDLRSMVRYETFNLLDSYGLLGKFDVVFCRNVLIYFDQETKASILERMADAMTSDGALFLGGAESVIGISSDFRPAPGLRGVYQIASDQDAAGRMQQTAAAGGV